MRKRGGTRLMSLMQRSHVDYTGAGGQLPLLEFVQQTVRTQPHMAAMLDVLMKWAVNHIQRAPRAVESVSGLLQTFKASQNGNMRRDNFRHRLSVLLQTPHSLHTFSSGAGSVVRTDVFEGVQLTLSLS